MNELLLKTDVDRSQHPEVLSRDAKAANLRERLNQQDDPSNRHSLGPKYVLMQRQQTSSLYVS